jgi:hypothetical protein
VPRPSSLGYYTKPKPSRFYSKTWLQFNDVTKPFHSNESLHLTKLGSLLHYTASENDHVSSERENKTGNETSCPVHPLLIILDKMGDRKALDRQH